MTSNEVDAALAAAPGERGRLLLDLHEDQWYDRKSIRVAPRDLAIALSGMANAEGGVLVVGLTDEEVEGVSGQPEKLNRLRQCSLDFIEPPVRAEFEDVACVTESGSPDHLLVARVGPSERIHEIKGGECYLRVGDSTRKLTYAQRQELHYEKGQTQFDGLPLSSNAGISDLDAPLLQAYKRRLGAGSNVKSVLKARNLITRDDKLTNAAYLLFGKNPQDVFPEAYIRIVKFLSSRRGTGANLNVDDENDIRIERPVPWAIQDAAEEVDRLIPKRRSLTAEGTFEAIPIVPRDAWLEGIVNAAIHRSYSLAGDHIRVEIYPDRIEIESPGRFPGLANPEHPLDVSRFARNPRIARVCADLRIGQEIGEGIKRIYGEMRRVGLTDPVYRQTSGSVRLSLAALPRLDRRVAARLPSRSQEVLDAMRAADSPLGTGQLAELLGMTRPTLSQRLKALEAEELIRWVGKSPRDPRAVWVLPDD